jgi:hypothetical protein
MDEHDRPDPTGEPAVDDALRRLGDLAEEPLERHAAVFDDVHRLLHEALADLDRA